MLDGFADVPNQLLDAALLANISIDGELNAGMSNVTGMRLGGDGPHGRTEVKGFADAPRTTLLLHVVL